MLSVENGILLKERVKKPDLASTMFVRGLPTVTFKALKAKRACSRFCGMYFNLCFVSCCVSLEAKYICHCAGLSSPAAKI